MSYTTALGVTPDQRPITLEEFRNGHGWSPSIWDRLLRHHGHTVGWFANDAGLDALWKSVEELPEWQQAALVLTFDTGVIPWQAFEWAAENLDEFEKRLPAPDGHVNHVPGVANLLRERPECPLFGVWGTSVSENPFDPRIYHDDKVCPTPDEHGWCPSHGTGIPLYDGAVEGMYVLERHRSLLPPPKNP